jgi:hypothetical protein
MGIPDQIQTIVKELQAIGFDVMGDRIRMALLAM